ncbi:lytic transglycosylase domain-containing protein [Wenzhouxiangella marina]|uniref:Transglycosylase n=1 Tax=Wenzhouxiangella marina TaxID=1579979 RepID=A0A0K0XY07_9GAMM|nr:lytic transglycosylase domain-containing protein [Wenzhouxiangella marina]AKS42517.1 transglycosylase [Wenzhouxiangella marina]MBB6085706.1 soluble lytic murein transglycosylase-like protein [Wenzhouxiangella marina]
MNVSKLFLPGLMLALLMLSDAAVAQIYTYTDENGITVFTDRKPDENRYRVHNLGCYGTCRQGVDWDQTPLRHDAYSAEIQAASEIFGVEQALIRAIMHAESWFQPEAVSRSGAQGLMQLMPATQERFGVEDAFDPLDNITAGVAYLAWLQDEFDRDMTRVIAAYNAGENAVKRHGGVPPYSETREYLRRVNILYRRYRGSS